LVVVYEETEVREKGDGMKDRYYYGRNRKQGADTTGEVKGRKAGRGG
jgi:hypothetical protein